MSGSWQSEKRRETPPRDFDADPIGVVECIDPMCDASVYCRLSEVGWWLRGHLAIVHQEVGLAPDVPGVQTGGRLDLPQQVAG